MIGCHYGNIEFQGCGGCEYRLGINGLLVCGLRFFGIKDFDVYSLGGGGGLIGAQSGFPYIDMCIYI